MYRTITRLALSLVLTLLSLPCISHAQTAFEDASGDSSILMKDAGGFARVNVSDTSVRIGYLFDLSNSDIFYGFEVSGKLSGKFASLFAANKPSPEGRFRFNVGRRFLLSDKPHGEPTRGKLTDDWLTFQVGYRRARYKLFIEENAFESQVRKQNFDGYSAVLAYNALFKNSHGPILLGVSGGVERRNNVDDLDEIEINDQFASVSSGTTQRTAVARQNVLSGTYKEMTAVPINTDVVWFPRQFESRIGLDFFTRSSVGQGNRGFEPGLGLFFTKDKSPTRVLGGISFSVKDG